MLSISEPLKGDKAGDYYLNLGVEDYYLKGGEPPGKWAGRGADLLKLSGKVKAVPFKNLLSGFSPDRKRAFTQNAGREDRRQGWDLTFSAPKSVSVLWSQASAQERKALERAHEKAVNRALSYLEEEASYTRRGRAGKNFEATPLIAALFQHGTSRALEPQLHTHAIVINLGFRADGTTGSLETRPLFKHKMRAGAVYQKEFARELQATFGFGVQWNGQTFETVGIAKEVCEHFSTRRREILSALKERGLSSAAAAKIATLKTRRKKSRIPRAELFAAWERVGESLGFGPKEAAAFVKECAERKQAQSYAEDRAWSNDTRNRHEEPKKTREREEPAENTLDKESKMVWWRTPRSGPPQKWTGFIAKKKTPFGDIIVARKYLFPKAPKWNPLHNLKAPAIYVTKKAWGVNLVKDAVHRIKEKAKKKFAPKPVQQEQAKAHEHSEGKSHGR